MNHIPDFEANPQEDLLRLQGHRNARSIAEITDRELVKLLISPQKHLKFSRICNKNPALFGLPVTALRAQVQRRRRYLASLQDKNPEEFASFLASLGLSERNINIVHTQQVQNSTPPPENRPIMEHHGRAIMPRALGSPFRENSVRDSERILSEVQEEEFTLNFTYGTQNRDGMMVLRTNDVVKGQEVFDLITIYKPLLDPDDHKSVKATLHDDGRGITIAEPSVPGFIIKDWQTMHELEHTSKCELTVKSHNLAVAQVRNSPFLLQKKTTFSFPDCITCKPANNTGKNKLKNEFRMLRSEPDRNGLQTLRYYIYWTLIIDREPRLLSTQDSNDSDAIGDAVKRMSMFEL